MASHQEAMDRKSNKSVTSNELPETRYKGSKSMPFIIGNETCERLGSIGASTNLLVYLTTVFNMKAITATTLVNTFSGTANLASFPGAILCDSYFGRYNTLLFSSLASFAGMLVLMLTSAIPKLHPSHCDGYLNNGGNSCHRPTTWQMSILLGGLGLMVIGSGGIRPCTLPFGADQFNKDSQSGKKGIKRLFSIYYFSMTSAAVISLTAIAYVQAEISWVLGFAIPTVLMAFSVLFFFMGSKIYVKVNPEGTPLVKIIRVLMAATKKRRLMSSEQPWLSLNNHNMETTSSNTSKLSYTDQFRFLDKAAIIDPRCDSENLSDGSSKNPWRLCTMQEVEETKCLLRVTPIWISSIIYYTAIIQQNTFGVFQALQSDRRIGSLNIPAASYSSFMMIGITIMILIHDRIITPTLQRFTRKDNGLTPLQKMGCGMSLAVVVAVISGLVEEKRKIGALARPIGKDPKRGFISPLSGFWLIPQLTLMGFSEALTVVSHIELYYTQLPEDMRSIAGSFVFVGFAVSSYFSNFVVLVVKRVTGWIGEDLNEGRLDLFYYFVAVIEVLNLVYFMVSAKWFRYKANDTSYVVDVLVK